MVGLGLGLLKIDILTSEADFSLILWDTWGLICVIPCMLGFDNCIGGGKVSNCSHCLLPTSLCPVSPATACLGKGFCYCISSASISEIISPLSSSLAHVLSGKLIEAQVSMIDSDFPGTYGHNMNSRLQHLNPDGRRLRHDSRLIVEERS